MRAKSAVLPGEDPAVLQARFDARAASLKPQDEVDRFLVEKAAHISWMLDRAERALAAREAADRHGALERSFQEADDVVLMGNRLLYDPRGPMALYPHGPIGLRGPWWISWSKDPDDQNQPAVVLNLLESTALGCAWLLDRWGELRAVLEAGLNWQAPDRFKVIRLLGRQPLDALDDPRVMAIYRACAAMGPRGAHPIEDVGSEMSEEDWQRYRERAEDRGATAKRIKEPEEGLAVLLDLIAGEEERLEGVLAALLAREEARSEDPGFGDSKEAERLRWYQLTYNRLLLRILETLRKRRREADSGAIPRCKVRRPPHAAPSPTDQPPSGEDATNEAISPEAPDVEHGPTLLADDDALTSHQGSKEAPEPAVGPSDHPPEVATNEAKHPRPGIMTNEPKLPRLPARVLTAAILTLLVLLLSAGFVAAYAAAIVVEYADQRPSGTTHLRESNLPSLRTLRHPTGNVLEMSTSENHRSGWPGAEAHPVQSPHPSRSSGPVRDERRAGTSPRFRDFPCNATVL